MGIRAVSKDAEDDDGEECLEDAEWEGECFQECHC